MRGRPPGPRELEPFLDNVTVGTLDFPGPYRETLLDRPLIVELIQAVAQIAIAGSDRGIAIGLDERGQSRQDERGLVGLQSIFLLVEPRLRIIGVTDFGRFAQILAEMEEIDPIVDRSIKEVTK